MAEGVQFIQAPAAVAILQRRYETSARHTFSGVPKYPVAADASCAGVRFNPLIWSSSQIICARWLSSVPQKQALDLAMLAGSQSSGIGQG